MDKNLSPAFRTAMGGFNKNDVNAYIAKLSRDFDETKTSLEEEISSLKSRLSEADSKLSEISEKQTADSLREELERANALIAAQTEQIENAKSELEAMKAQLEEKTAQIERLAAYEEKAEQYETMTNRMGEIFIEATADAERIRSEAKNTSATLLRDTEEKCREKILITEKRLDEFAITRKAEIAQLFDETQLKINAALKEFSEKSRALANESLTSSIDNFALFDNNSTEA